jgi:quinol monooxygenase YgiN
MAKRKAKKAASKRTSHAKRPAARTSKLPNGAVTLVVACKAREGQESLLEAELRALVAPSRREGGCIVYDLHRGLDVPGTFLFHEVWSSRAAHLQHTQTPHFLRWNARKDALLASRESSFWTQVL